jgi:hypothetical protein
MFTEGRKPERVKVWECQGVRLVIILYRESGLARLVQHSQRFCSVPIWKACFTYENLSQKRGGILQSYTYSLRVGGKLYLLVTQVCIRSLPLMWSRGKKPHLPMPHDLCLFRFMIVFVSCLMASIAPGEVGRGHSQNGGVQTWLLSVS